MSSVNEIYVVIDADTRRFNSKVKKAQNTLQTSSKQMERSAKRVEQAQSQLTAANLAVGASIALSARKIIELTDAYTGMQNMLRMVTDDQEDLNKTTEEMFRIANDTRASVESTTVLYSRMTRATEKLNISQEEMVGLTKTINQAFAISGASTQEMNGSIRQLSQAFASGALRGDEFNSIAEQAPIIMEAVSKATGKSAGELRELAAQGAITSEILLESLQRYQDKIENDFAKSQKTFGQQMTIARNAAIEFVSTNEDVVKAVEKAGEAVVFLSQNLDALIVAGKAIAVLMTGRYLAGFVMVTAAKWKDLVATNALIAANSRFVVAGNASIAVMARMRAAFALLGGATGVIITAGLALATFVDWNEKADAQAVATANSIKYQIDQMQKLSDTDLATRFEVNAKSAERYKNELEEITERMKELSGGEAEMPRFAAKSDKNEFAKHKAREKELKAHIERTEKLRDEAAKEQMARDKKVSDAKKKLEHDELIRLDQAEKDKNAKMVAKLDQRLLTERQALEKRLADEANAVQKHADELLKKEEENSERSIEIKKQRDQRLLGLQKEYETEISRIESEAKAKRDAEQQDKDDEEAERQKKIKAIKDQYKTESELEQQRYAEQRQAFVDAVGGELEAKALHNETLQAMELEHQQKMKEIEDGFSVTNEELFERLAAERDYVQAHLDAEQEMLRIAKEREIFTADELNRAQEAMEQRHAQARANIVQAEMDAKFNTTRDILGSMNTIAESMGKKGVKIQKAISLANAGMSIATGIAKAQELGFPANIAEMARVVAVGAKVMSSIKSAQYGSAPRSTGGGGGGSAASASAPRATAPAQAQQTQRVINLDIQGGANFSAEQVRELIGQINEQTGDGVQLNT